MNSAIRSTICLVVAAAALCAWPSQTRFAVGDCSVNLMPSLDNIALCVTFSGRTLMFAYRTDGWLEDGRKRVQFHSDRTNSFVRLENTPAGVRAEYVHSLYVGKGESRRLAGFCSNEVSFAEGRVDVRATMHPAEPGRYRFYYRQKASQVVVFPGFAEKWVGTTLHLITSKGVAHSNELMPHSQYDMNAWGMNMNHTGPAREMVFGNVPDVIRFTGTGDARFSCNRYKGGFEASAFMLNDDVMHKPSWDKPVSFEYSVQMSR